jgi:predicted RNA polymerase sigma factor
MALVRRDLVDSALSLARMLHLLMPNDAEIRALLALMLLIDARADPRLSATGRLLLLLSEQDRTRWDPRLDGDRRTVRRPAQAVALTGGRAQPCRGRGPARRSAGRPRRADAAVRLTERLDEIRLHLER